MKLNSLLALPLTAALLSLPQPAQAEDACTLPGILVLEDPAGDSGIPTAAATVPVPVASLDIRSLHMAEPAAMPGKLVFTYKIEDLSQLPPSVGYILRFSTDVAPATGDDDYVVAMLTGVDGSASFVYGTTGFIDPAPPRFLKVAGELDPASNFTADGTITLVLDKSAIPGLDAGLFVFNILPTVRIMTPTADLVGLATNADNATILDDVDGAGFYDVVGNESCGGGKSGVLNVGAWSPLALLVLAGFGLGVRRRWFR